MDNREKRIDLNKIKTYSLHERTSKVSTDAFGTVHRRGDGLAAFFDKLPRILAGNDLRDVIAAICDAAVGRHKVIFGMGAHVIKTGLSPIVIDLMERGIISAVAMNGAGIIHDLEVAMVGRTSEEVAAVLDEGQFGMARETGEFLGRAISRAGSENLGLGEAVGAAILENQLPHADASLLASAVRLGLPATIHVAMGTDIIHMHPAFDPAAAGAASHRDFLVFAELVADLQAGVYMNVGSAVILPEVFLKAITLVRNLGHQVDRFTTVNLDFIQHYRPLTNVVHRPTSRGGRGIRLTGHHEILLPLIAAGVIELLPEKQADNSLADRPKG